jgi:predicted CXXCH cytochrome family protein
LACHYSETTTTQNRFLKRFRRGVHGGKAKNSPVACLKCHLPHTSNTPHLLGFKGAEGNFQGEFLCFACHKELEEEFTYTSHHPVSSKELGLECISCHNPHLAKKGKLTDPSNTLREAQNTISFCLACHGSSLPQAIKTTGTLVPYTIAMGSLKSPFLAGWNKTNYHNSAHSLAGLDCLTCHDAHASRLFSLLALKGKSRDLTRESEICFSCHKRSSKAGRVKKEFEKKYHHPIETGGVHKDTEDQMDLAYSPKDGKRHVTCSDCHNSHQATAENVLKGIGGVNKLLEPVTQVKEEYQVCFKCHSSFTIQPPGQEDLAASFSSLNASFHPLLTKGKNVGIKKGAFIGSWNSSSRVTCRNCHEPHGSDEAKLLRGSLARKGPVDKSDFCFSCHNPSAYLTSSTLTRFAAHPIHSRKFSCLVCHAAHGSEESYLLQANFIYQGKSYKLNYARTRQGGSCSTNPQSGCHGEKEYEKQY